MDNAYPLEAWKRLGEVLEARRGELGYGFRQREKFLEDRGGPPPSVKTLARLERGERASYPESTIARVESLYGYAPGSFRSVLEGGAPELLPVRSGPPVLPGNPFASIVDPALEPEGDAAWVMFPAHTREDRTLRWIWRLPFSEEERTQMVEDWRRRRREAKERERGAAGLPAPECNDPDARR